MATQRTGQPGLPLAMLRARWAAFAGTFVTVALGVALIAATGLVFVSAQPGVPDRYASADAVARAPVAGVDPEAFPSFRPWSADAADALAARFAALPGVTAAVPEHVFYAQVVHEGRAVGRAREGDPLGRGWSNRALSAYPLVDGVGPTAEGEVAIDAGLGVPVGTTVSILTGAGPRPHRVTGLVGGPFVYLSDAAARAAGPGVTTIALRAASVRDLGTVPGDFDLLTGERLRELEPESDARIRWIGAQLLVAMVTLGCFAAVFVIASTSALAVLQRRRDLALLRLLGLTPRQLRRLVVLETALLSLVAGLAGAALGAAVAPLLGRALVDAGLEPAGFVVRADPRVLAGAVAAGLMIALLGVIGASRRAARVRPAEALRAAESERRPMTRSRWILGTLVLAGGALLAVASAAAGEQEMMNLALFASMTLMVACALLAPALLPPLIRVLTWPFGRRRGAVGLLVRESAATEVRRTAGTAAPVLLTVGFAVLITGMVATMTGAFATRTARETGVASVAVPVDGVPGLSDAALAAVGPAAAALESEVALPGGSRYAYGLDPAALAYAAARTRVVAGTLPDALGDGVAVVDWAAASGGIAVGDTVPMLFADGRAREMPVVALFRGGTLYADVLVDRALLRAHDPSALASRAYLTGGPATGPAAPPAAAAALGARVLSAAEFARAADDEDDLVRIFVLTLTALACGYTAISVANTLLMATAGRRADLEVLRRSGATRRQILAVVAGEATLVVALGTLLGGAVATAGLLGVREGLSEAVGTPVALAVEWPLTATVVAVCLALAISASVLPAAAALRDHSPPAA